MKIILACATILALAGGPVLPGTASRDIPRDQPVTWAVSPARDSGSDGRAWVESTLDPGETITEHLSVTNLGGYDMRFVLTAADGYLTDTGRFNMLPSDTPSSDAGLWITMQDFVDVAAGSSAIVPFTVSVPANATPGDHAAGVAASVVSRGTDAGGSSVGVESRIGFRVMTRVTGELRPELSLTEVSAEYVTSWNPFSPGTVRLGYVAVNTGNTTLSVAERIDGGTPTGRGDLFTGESRSVAPTAVTAWPLGLVTVEVELIPKSGEQQAVHARTTATVWAIPWPQLTMLLGVVLIVGAFTGGRRRSRRRVETLLERAREEGRQETKGSSGLGGINREMD